MPQIRCPRCKHPAMQHNDHAFQRAGREYPVGCTEPDCSCRAIEFEFDGEWPSVRVLSEAVE